VQEVHINAGSVAPFVDLVGAERVRAVEREAELIRKLFKQRAIWNINSTAAGGGVAEMLRSLLRYARGLRVDARWAVMDGPPAFFRITKRVHNALHGSMGDGSPLGREEASLYEQVARENVIGLNALVRPGDAVICHDPQTAGLVPHLMKGGALVVWRCHIGHDVHDEEVERGWAFLRPYLQDVPVAVFSRESYAPPWLKGKRTVVLPPNIDPFLAKNQLLDQETIRSILTQVGLVEGPARPGESAFVRDDGSRGRVDHKAEVLSLGPLPAWHTPLVVQVSRWDEMKDPLGVLRGFTEHLGPEMPGGAHLVLAGPTVRSVADDPEADAVFTEVEQTWRALPDSLRRSVHLALLPMQDVEENAAIVNALQRHAAVIVQKSLQEGFGLTVTEAMWKRRPVVASAVGGIADQIRNRVDGLLIRDPTNLDEFANALELVLCDDVLAQRLGDAGYERVKDNYLSITALTRWAELIRQQPPPSSGTNAEPK
jgi:trehalose synthase